MVKAAKTKIYSSKGRNSLYLPSVIVGDDRFPFKVGQELVVRIEHMRLIVETPTMAEIAHELETVGGERTTFFSPEQKSKLKPKKR